MSASTLRVKCFLQYVAVRWATMSRLTQNLFVPTYCPLQTSSRVGDG
jgi:hypothetical protein